MDEKNKARKVHLVNSQCWAELGFVLTPVPTAAIREYALEYHYGIFPGVFHPLPLTPILSQRSPLTGAEESFAWLLPLPASPSSGWEFHL